MTDFPKVPKLGPSVHPMCSESKIYARLLITGMQEESFMKKAAQRAALQSTSQRAV